MSHGRQLSSGEFHAAGKGGLLSTPAKDREAAANGQVNMPFCERTRQPQSGFQRLQPQTNVLTEPRERPKARSTQLSCSQMPVLQEPRAAKYVCS